MSDPHPDDFKSLSDLYIELHGDMRLARMLRQLERAEKALDALLNHCDKESGECSFCGKTICPYGDGMHFHHDGCPSCTAGSK